MNTWTRNLKSIYRKQPVVGFGVTVGAVNVAIGGLTEHWALMSLGLSVVGVAIAFGFRQMQVRRPLRVPQRRAAYVLPPAGSSLPMLSVPKQNPPER